MSDQAAPTGIAMKHFTANELAEVRDVLINVYAEVYADRLHEEFQTVERFAERLEGHASGPGWECVVGYDDGEPVGYAYGYTLPTRANWWKGLRTPVDPGLIEETGRRTFALCELMVRAPWRGTGAAKAIHDELVSNRPEERVTLLVERDHPRVRALYERWGYQWIGELLPFPDAPLFDSLILPLRTCDERVEHNADPQR